MNIHILLFLIMGVKTNEYIAQEKIQQDQIQLEKIQQELIEREKAEQSKSVPSKSKPIIQYKDGPAPPPIRICNKGEISSDCRKLTQAEISGNVVRGKKQTLDDQTP